MTDSSTHIDTLRVQAPEEAAQRMQLRLSTQLAGADLRPPGLAPAQVLLVRELPDPEPGGLDVESAVAMLDRTWERAVRDALNGALHRADRPTEGRVPRDAEAVLFRDAAEAWACWALQRTRPESLAGTVWWVRSLERSADVPSAPRDSMRTAEMWRVHSRLLPPVIGSLAAWDRTEEVLQQLSEPDAKMLLQAVCTAYDVSAPSTPRASESPPNGRVKDRSEEAGPTDAVFSEDAAADEPDWAASQGASEIPPWAESVETAGGPPLRTTLAQHSRAHRALFGVALALWEDPVPVRSRAFRAAWQAWREAATRGHADPRKNEVDPEGTGRAREGEDPGRGGDTSADVDDSLADSLTRDGADRRSERDTKRDDEDGRQGGAYAMTDLGGVLYLVNVLDTLGLPEVATTPPVGEHVGAWAVLEALARALLGPDDDALRPNDPLWRVLATLDGRRPGTPAGQALTDADVSPDAYRMPSAWLEALPIDPPVDGQWAVTDGRLRMWTDLGCVADLEAGGDPVAQAEAEWARVPNTGDLQRAASSDAMPISPEPTDCARALARWAARTAPYVRYRLAAALDVEEQEADWTADLFRAEGKLYTADTHVDLVLPLNAARIDARAAGLDRSPGWWPAGGRVVRFHFRKADV